MNWILIAYIVVYAAISAGGVWTDIKDRYAWWIVAVDALASAFGVAVLILYAVDFHLAELDLVFRFGFPVFILCSLYVAIIDVYDQWKSDPEERITLLIGAVIALLIETPSFVICYLYAFGT